MLLSDFITLIPDILTSFGPFGAGLASLVWAFRRDSGKKQVV